MITVKDARSRVADKLSRNLAAWATAEQDVAQIVIALKPPTEREMLADERAAEAWAREWAALPEVEGVVVDREARTWRSIGRQIVPIRLTITSACAAGAFVGGALARDFTLLSRRADAAVAQLGNAVSYRDGTAQYPAVREVVRQHARRILELADAEVTRLLDAAAWLAVHDVNGLRPRQVPVRGVDSKWFEKHRTLLTALHRAVTGDADLGVVDSDPLLRVRFLDATLAPGGVTDLAAPVSQLAALTVAPRVALLVENRETLLALPSMPGVVAVHSSGYAIDVLDHIGWVRDTPVVYWGDLDSHGFAILHRLRTHHGRVVSALMDTETLEAHLDLAVVEPQPARGAFPTLTESENATLERLRSGDLRLEQERIPWSYAITALKAVIEAGVARTHDA